LYDERLCDIKNFWLIPNYWSRGEHWWLKLCCWFSEKQSSVWWHL